jgi:hypothetical protein
MTTAATDNEPSTIKRQQQQQQQRVQQPPRTPQEFAFAHRTLRKLVQDSEFFPECAQRDDWFKCAPHPQHMYKTDASLTNHNYHDGGDDEGESSSSSDDESSDNNSHRTTQTPLFIDYCNRSLESFNSSNNSLNNNYNNHRRGTIDSYGGGSVGYNGGSVGSVGGSAATNNNTSTMSLSPLPISPRDVVEAITSASATAKNYQLPFQVVKNEMMGVNKYGGDPRRRAAISTTTTTTATTTTAATYNNTTLARRPSFPPRLLDETGGGRRRGNCDDDEQQLVNIMSNLSTNPGTIQSIQQTSQNAQQQTSQSIQQTTQQTTNQKKTTRRKKKKKHSVYSINENELEFGKILGNGGFGQVRLAKIRSVRAITTTAAATTTAKNVASSEWSTAAATAATMASTTATPASDNATTSDNATDATTTKATVDANIDNNKKKNRYYAMKYLSPTKLSPSSSTATNNNNLSKATDNNNNNNSSSEKQKQHGTTSTYSKFERAIADLAIEARFLSLLSHTNIIKLYYVSEGSLEELFNCDDGSSTSGGEGGRRRRRRTGSGRVGNSSVGSLDPPGSICSSGGGVGVTSRRRRRKVGVVVGKNNNKSSRGGGNIVKRKNNIYHPRRQHGYFLLLDPLCETLHQRIQSVYVQEVIDTPLRIYNTTTAATNNNFDLSTTSITSLSEINTNNKKYISNESQARIQLSNRLSSLKSIASALQYLHEDCNIVYRDIKPGNIGFYRRYDNCGCQCGHGGAHSNFFEEDEVGGGSRSDGTSPHCTCNHTDIPKLFDFGLAKELKSKYRKCHPNHNNDIDPPTYKLTSASGSRRYMSPEVALREPYNHKADVYSFGVVLYQIAALVVPFDGLESHERDVMRGGIRPDLSIPSRDSSVRRTRDFRKHYVKERDRERKNLLLSKRAKCVWPEGLGALIGECWDGDMRKRPEMREVVDRLDACIQELKTGQI